jgi:hypothetical protein
MSLLKHTELELRRSFQPRRKRHSLNGQMSVLHCHHYTVLYTQLALDAKETELLMEVAEDAFYTALQTYFVEHPTAELSEKIELAQQYYQIIGLGLSKVVYLGKDSAEVELQTSLLDSGWLKKWGQHDEPVNYISAGYFAALCAAVQNEPLKTFHAEEVQSIVMGAPTSIFKIVRR